MKRPYRFKRAARPKRRRRAVRWSYVLLLPAAFAGVAAALVGAQALLDHPVRSLHLQGRFEGVTPVEIQEAMAPGLERGLLSLNLGELRTRVEALDWVETARIGREWPDALIVRVVEHEAVARWGETGLLNYDGELFTNDSRHAFPELPSLAGPPNTEWQVAQHYLALQAPLEKANLALKALNIDERGSWSLELRGGQRIRVGRRDVEQRLDRFFQLAAPLLMDEFNRVSHVDLRYTNGFSVGWRFVAEGEPVAAAGGE